MLQNLSTKLHVTCRTCTASKEFDVAEYSKLITLGATPAEIDARSIPAAKEAEA